MPVIRTIRNPKLDLAAEIHRHRLNNPPPGTDPTVYYCTVNGQRPAESQMRGTEDECVRDAADAIGLPKDWQDPEADAGKKAKGK